MSSKTIHINRELLNHLRFPDIKVLIADSEHNLRQMLTELEDATQKIKYWNENDYAEDHNYESKKRNSNSAYIYLGHKYKLKKITPVKKNLKLF